MTLKRCEHIGQILPVYSPKRSLESDCNAYKTDVRPSSTPHSSTVSVDPDEILPARYLRDFHMTLKEFDSVFKTHSGRYNGSAGPFKAVVNMGPTKPPQRKGRVPQYARNKLEELQDV